MLFKFRSSYVTNLELLSGLEINTIREQLKPLLALV
jgi:hypothetical protein